MVMAWPVSGADTHPHQLVNGTQSPAVLWRRDLGNIDGHREGYLRSEHRKSNGAYNPNADSRKDTACNQHGEALAN
jgi:hypothetical protein